MNLSWEDLAAISAICTMIFAVLLFVLKPLADRNWLETFKRNQATIKSVLNGWYNVAEQRKTFETLQRDHSELYRRFGEMIQSSEANARGITDEMRRLIGQQNERLEHIATQIDINTEKLSYVYGKLDVPWDGRTERRQGDRRD